MPAHFCPSYEAICQWTEYLPSLPSSSETLFSNKVTFPGCVRIGMQCFGGHHLMNQREQHSSSPRGFLPWPSINGLMDCYFLTGQDSKRQMSLAQCTMGLSALQSLPLPPPPAHTGSLVLGLPASLSPSSPSPSSLFPSSITSLVCLLPGSENTGWGYPVGPRDTHPVVPTQ